MERYVAQPRRGGGSWSCLKEMVGHTELLPRGSLTLSEEWWGGGKIGEQERREEKMELV